MYAHLKDANGAILSVWLAMEEAGRWMGRTR